MRVTERYPNPAKGCLNGGALVDQKQMYYYFKKEGSKIPLRIDKLSHAKLKYIKESTPEPLSYTLENREVKNKVCLCPTGYFGLNCEQAMYTKCFVNITNPPTYDMEACRNGNQSHMNDYMFSIRGYDPCFYLNFSETFEFRFKLECKYLDSTGLVQIHPYNVGYQYEDVIGKLEYDAERFDFSTNEAVKMRVKNTTKVLVTLDFYNWKWIS